MPVTLSWPLVGREEEIRWASDVLARGSSRGIVVTGPAGVGKTRLARELLAWAGDHGAVVEWVQATLAAASIPMGVFAGLLPARAAREDRVALFQLCADALRQRATAGQQVILGVDDAHLLDETSAALVQHVAAYEIAFVVATVRARSPCPDAIAALWKELEVPRLELQPLSADATAALLEGTLGGELAADVLRWAFGASEGHVLYLRELVNAAVGSGALVVEGGRWRLRSPPVVSPALRELISSALEDLSSAELDMAGLLALGEPVQVSTVTDILGTDPLAALTRKGLAVVEGGRSPDERIEARLSHPLYSEVVRATMPVARGIELRLLLADAVRCQGLDHRGDALRVATWLDEAGAAVDELLLAAAADDALAAGAPAVAEEFARRLPPGPEAAMALGAAYVLERRFGEAETLLGGWERDLSRGALADAYLERRALRVLHFGLRRSGEALQLLDRASKWFDDARWRDRVELMRLQVSISGVGGNAALAAPGLAALSERGDVLPEVRRQARVMYAISLYMAGRTQEALVVTAPLRPSLPLRDGYDANALAIWWSTREETGSGWPEVLHWLEEADRVTALANDPLTRGEIVTALAFTLSQRGRPVTAARRAREAIEILERIDTVRRLPLAWLCLAASTTLQGDALAARVALAGYEAAVGDVEMPYWRLWREEVSVRAALAVLEGDSTRGIGLLLDGVPRAVDRPVERAHLLYAALRAGAPPRSVASTLAVAAEESEAPLVDLFAEQASAQAAGDGAALLGTAEQFGEIGASPWAAEAAVLAAESYARGGSRASAGRALAASAQFQDRCEEIWSPVLARAEPATPSQLTQRERDIVRLAAAGVSNAEIAERLALSVRTVESHLYRAMNKLGVTSRRELPTD
jgi:DNA-binding CsgD family transcriptional regulator